jgi:hypothetical protein
LAAVIKDIDRGLKNIERNVKLLKGCQIKVGLMGSDAVNGTSVIDYAVYNEFGTSRIPARPFMSTTYDENVDKTYELIERMAGQLMDSKLSTKQLLDRLGLWYSSQIKKTIRRAKEWAVPNAPGTIAQKGSSSPLIDTGRMLNAVNFEVTVGTK